MSLKNVIGKGIFIIGAILLLEAALGVRLEAKTIIAAGEAVGTSFKARDEALQRALRNALENGIGVYISSESRVKNYQLLEDKIYSRVKGYVKKYNILSETKGDDGVYYIKIEADVANEELKKDLSDLGLLITQKGKPRIMIIVTEEIEGKSWQHFYSSEGMAAQAQMENVFLGKGFPLVSKEQMQEIKERDTGISFDDPARAAALGHRFGAELVIIGKAVSDAVEAGSPYGLKTHSYAAEVQAKVVKVDTATIIASESSDAKAWDAGKYVAARKSLKDAANTLSLALIDKITAQWRDEIYNVATVQLVADKINFDQLTALEEGLKALPGVQNVFRRSFAKNTAVIDVELQGTTGQLGEGLSGISLGGEARAKIVGTTANRIDLSISE